MEEIEVKILEINKEEIEQKLLSLGAKKIFEGDLINHIYYFEDQRLDKKSAFIRLRKQGDTNFITYKEFVHSKGAKVTKEHEVKVEDFEKARIIFEHLGLSDKIDSYQKKRTTYQLGEILFEIEELTGEYAYIPTFMEIEGPTIEAVQNAAKSLGFTDYDCKSWGGDLLKDYYKNKMLSGRVVEGKKQGAKFVRIYSDKFKSLLGFEPFPGTLNLEVDAEKRLAFVKNLPALDINPFENEQGSFGGVRCFKIKINRDFDGAIVVPLKTTHEKDVLEIIASTDLRKHFKLDDDSEVIIRENND